MATSWILVANASKAQLFEAPRAKLFNGNAALSLIEEFSHPQSRLRRSELVSDQPGHSRNGTLVESSEPKHIEAEAFAKELAGRLEEGRLHHNYDDLIIVASPQFHGILKKHINNHIKTMLSVNIEKDYTNYAPKQLINNIRGYL